MDINTETESLIWTWCYSFSAMWLSCFVLKRFAWNDPVEGGAAKPIFKLIGDLLFSQCYSISAYAFLVLSCYMLLILLIPLKL